MRKIFSFINRKTLYLATVPLAPLSIRDFIPPGYADLSNLGAIVQTILNLAFSLAGLIAVFYLIYGGYTYITSGGGEGAEQAKKTILNAIIGIIIIVAAFALVNFVWQRLVGTGYETEQFQQF